MSRDLGRGVPGFGVLPWGIWKNFTQEDFGLIFRSLIRLHIRNLPSVDEFHLARPKDPRRTTPPPPGKKGNTLLGYRLGMVLTLLSMVRIRSECGLDALAWLGARFRYPL